ncbi:MAG: hypothetical protein GOV15_01895, partial [Candidatus Diapherotrites archaeon]|nr:hypothetical protein [Candidatus Diapherotrites archaeon]
MNHEQFIKQVIAAEEKVIGRVQERQIPLYLELNKLLQKHKDKPLYYPASGTDISSPLAMGAEHIILQTHPETTASKLKEYLQDLGSTEIKVKQKKDKHEITFNFAGQDRKITLYHQDANTYVPSELKNGVSAFFIKAPTGYEINKPNVLKEAYNAVPE